MITRRSPGEREAIRVVIAEDHPFFRDHLLAILRPAPDIAVLAAARDGRAALDAIRRLRPDVAVLDVGLPEVDGCEVARTARAEHIEVEIIFLTVCDDRELYEESLTWDVKGYLLKDSTPHEIIAGVRAVAEGRRVASPAMTSDARSSSTRPPGVPPR